MFFRVDGLPFAALIPPDWVPFDLCALTSERIDEDPFGHQIGRTVTKARLALVGAHGAAAGQMMGELKA